MQKNCIHNTYYMNIDVCKNVAPITKHYDQTTNT